MSSYPPPFPHDPRAQRRLLRDQARLQRAQLRSMRRSSIIGPLLVIFVGVAFLLVQTGKFSNPTLFLWFSRWWPLLLVVLGLIRLVEWFLDQRARTAAQGGPTPQRTVGGGVAVLLGLLIIAGIVSSLSRSKAEALLGPGFHLNQDNIDQFIGDKHESTQTLTAACPDGTVVSIDNPHGNVNVSGSSPDDQLHVVADNQVFTRSDSEAASKMRDISPKIDRSGNQLQLSIPAIDGARTDLTVTLPIHVSLATNVNRGDIQVHSLTGSVAVTANHGDIDLSSLEGVVSAHINNGDSSLSAHSIIGNITVEGKSLDLTLSDITGSISLVGDFFGTTHLEHASGNIRFHTSRTDLQFARLDGELEISPNADLTASQITGPTILNTRNRNITLDRISGPLVITNRNGSIAITAAPPLGPISIENRNGEVDLTLPTASHFVLAADTTNADLENDFGFSRTSDNDHERVSGAVGADGPKIQISTTQADVSIHKANIVPLAPKPPTTPDLPPEARQAMREARKAIEQGRREAQRGMQEAEKEMKRAQEDQRHHSASSQDDDSH